MRGPGSFTRTFTPNFLRKEPTPAPIITRKRIQGVGLLDNGVLTLTFELSARADYFPPTYQGTPHRSSYRVDAEYHRRRIDGIAYRHAVEMKQPISVFAAAKGRPNVFVGIFGPGEEGRVDPKKNDTTP